jgi:acyl-coenzyme A synthetase/AMP-(fatty) acid ligase
MGHRIELGDIEVCASALEYVDECCCLYAASAEKIVLFCACTEENRKRLRKDLSVKLPKYMLPHDYVCFRELPHNRNGKIDRAGLLQDWVKNNTK